MTHVQTIKQLMQTNRPTLVVPVVDGHLLNGEVQQDYYQQLLNVFYPRGTQKGNMSPVLSSIIKRDNTTQTSPLEDEISPHHHYNHKLAVL
jgi:hypothetical protein